jgi:hypothetical protein
MMVSYEPKIPCEIRCMDPATVEAASRRPDPAGVEWVAYTCKFSGTKQSVLVIGDELAAGIMKSLPAVESLTGTKIWLVFTLPNYANAMWQPWPVWPNARSSLNCRNSRHLE